MTLPHALTAKQQEWAAHLEQAQQQNLSLQEYARRTGIKASSLYAARKQMCKARSQAATASVSFAEVRMTGYGPWHSPAVIGIAFTAMAGSGLCAVGSALMMRPTQGPVFLCREPVDFRLAIALVVIL